MIYFPNSFPEQEQQQKKNNNNQRVQRPRIGKPRLHIGRRCIVAVLVDGKKGRSIEKKSRTPTKTKFIINITLKPSFMTEITLELDSLIGI